MLDVELIHEKALVMTENRRDKGMLRVVDWYSQDLLLEHDFPDRIVDVIGGTFSNQILILTKERSVYALNLNDKRVHVIHIG